MSTTYPLPRSIREDVLVATAGQTVFGPYAWRLFDALDVAVSTQLVGATKFTIQTSGWTATPSGTAFPDLFTIVFDTGLAAGDQVKVRGERTHDRLTSVTQGGVVHSVALETELDRTAVVLQELRRDRDADAAAITALGALKGAAGSDAGIAFAWSTTTSGDPGAGGVRGNNAAMASITSLAFDDLDSAGGNVETTLQALDNSASAVKANIFLFDAGDKSNWLHVQLTAAFADQTGYWTGTVTYVNHNGSFASGAALLAQIIPNGDKGDTGPAGPATSYDDSVRVATTANVAITTGLEAGDSIDGVTLVAGDLVLVKDQTAPAENGVYVASASGAAARDNDYDTYDEHPGKAITVQEGTVHADSMWLCTSNTGGTLGTTAIAWAQRYGSASTTVEGLIKQAVAATINTGTALDEAVTPDALAGSVFGTAVIPIMPFDSTTDVAVGDGAGGVFFRVPAELNGMNIIGVAAANTTAGTGSGVTSVQIRRVRGGTPVDVLSTKLTIDPTEVDSSSAATPAVINTANDDLATGDQLYIDVDGITVVAAKGLLVEIRARLP